MTGFPLAESPSKRVSKEKLNFTSVIEGHELGVKWTDEKPETEVSLKVEPNSNCTDISLGETERGVQIPTWPGHGPPGAMEPTRSRKELLLPQA